MTCFWGKYHEKGKEEQNIKKHLTLNVWTYYYYDQWFEKDYLDDRQSHGHDVLWCDDSVARFKCPETVH